MKDETNIGISFGHYGEEREVNATAGEIAIYENILGVISSAGQDTTPVRITRKSGNYVAAVIGPTDIARFKWSDRAKWIVLPYSANGKDKIYISDPAEVFEYDRIILGHYFLAYSHLLLGYE